MSLRKSSKKVTICEVLRRINDMHQADTEHDQEVRRLLVTAEDMGKRMSWKLYEYNKKYDAGWWERNPDYEYDLKRRLSKSYLVADHDKP
jgi:hypothetical protein